MAEGWSVNQYDGLVELKMGEEYTVWLKDYGNRLQPVAVDKNGARTRTNDERLMLSRCAAPTPYGVFRSTYNKSLDD